MKRLYTDEHAAAGVNERLPEIETWPNQFPCYEIEIVNETVSAREYSAAAKRRGANQILNINASKDPSVHSEPAPWFELGGTL